MSLIQYYRTPGLSPAETELLLESAKRRISGDIEAIQTEYCFNVESGQALDPKAEATLSWLLSETFDPGHFASRSFLDSAAGSLLEVGPRLSFTTAWSTNAVSVCHACGLREVSRIERSRRYLVVTRGEKPLDELQTRAFLVLVHDRMTECHYPEPLRSFASDARPEPVFEVPLLEEGPEALRRLSKRLGLAFDEWDLKYYTNLFCNEIGRNPTNVECFDIAQSNSEHSRHWFFLGRLVIDGEELPKHLIGLIREPLERNLRNSTIAFKDNSSAIQGYRLKTIVPARPGQPCPFEAAEQDYDIIFTAETHNFPSGVAPFPGAETGTGGRIRDVQATGRGALVVAGTAAYCVGNLNIPGYELPWEDPSFAYPTNLASPLEIELEASNGASDYGNKFGEPVIAGYTRSCGLRLPDGERREWLKPIMFSGGIGQLDSGHRDKARPEPGMLVVKLGGPAYRIGMGGGAASSMVQGENVAELDFNAVQRGDAEMEQKLNRVIRACSELGIANPIVSIHDQGAGGSCNVLKEIVDPAGARIELRSIPVGDETLSALEIWGAEYQEVNALLLRPEDAEAFLGLCEREKVQAAFVGRITGDGRILVHDEQDGSTPVDLELSKVLGKMPQKTFELERRRPRLSPLELPSDLDVKQALERVLRLVSVGSKRFLTNKVDRSVTGLVAQQQCVGPLQQPLSDVAVIAQSHFCLTGAATSLGEQPLKGLINPASMARLTLGEAITNLVWARVSALEDVKCSGNWMWAAKQPGEGAALAAAAVALKDALIELGIAIDGGKDSLSMAALAPTDGEDQEMVKAPGSLVISTYVTCPDITQTVTPELKLPGRGRILFVNLAGGQARLGGSALAQVFGQLGDDCPDLEDTALLGRAFKLVQELLEAGLVSAGHDRSDGGLVTALLEMAFAGNCGLEIELEGGSDPVRSLFAEELGLLLEVSDEQLERVLDAFRTNDVPCRQIGRTLETPVARFSAGGQSLLDEDMRALRDLWEKTSYQLDRLQADPALVDQERAGLRERSGPSYRVSFQPTPTPEELLSRSDKPRVAIVREEGSNGDREMTSAFFAAGFEPWDISMSDLLAGRTRLDGFRGLVFVGGFSYADVLDSAKGWAGVIRFNPKLWEQFEAFYQRSDSFSLGVCNGCQLEALIGWVPWPGIPPEAQPRFVRNASNRFESRFSTVSILESPSIMLDGMEGSSLGIWVAHGEGRAYFPDPSIMERALSEGLAPVRFVDDQNRVTEAYPHNPNGSPAGIAGLCSPDGRHLVMMPHPERAFLKWQWGWMPGDMKRELAASPWLKMFQNARQWCARNG